jgi:hypothetical protein
MDRPGELFARAAEHRAPALRTRVLEPGQSCDVLPCDVLPGDE